MDSMSKILAKKLRGEKITEQSAKGIRQAGTGSVNNFHIRNQAPLSLCLLTLDSAAAEVGASFPGPSPKQLQPRQSPPQTE